MVVRKEKTAISAIGSMFGDRKTNNAIVGGLSVDHIRANEHHANHGEGNGYECLFSCYAVLSRATIAVLTRLSGCGLGSPLSNTRRLIATSRFVRGFSFGDSRNHGIIAPVFFDGLMSHGKPSGLPLPCGRSANPCDVSLPHGRRSGDSYSQTQGIKAMMLTLSSSVSTAFPSVPEPIYKPVTSPTGNASNSDVKKGGAFDALNTLSCSATASRAMLSATIRKNGCRRGNLPVSIGRPIAASCFARGVSFGGSSNHGVIASAFKGAVYPQFLTGSRAGGFQAYRFLMRGISTPHGLPSPWKGRAVLQTALGASVMMRTLTRNVSTVFPSIPEPIYHPVTSSTTAGSREPVSYDVTSDLNAVFDRCASEYASANREASLFNRTIRLNVLRGVAVEVLRFCDETLGRVYTPSKYVGG